jgi:GLPGLI family protein
MNLFIKKILFIFFTFSVYSQNSGMAIYSLQLPEYTDKNGRNDNILTEAKKLAESVNFILEFNATQSHFYYEKMINNEHRDGYLNDLIVVLSGSENFYDGAKSLSINKQIDGVLLKDSHAIKSWNITSESKIIDNYLCYKAEYIKKIKVNGVEKSKLVIAWFAPSLPYPYGPNGYNGLPGLILELNEIANKSKKYFLKNINLYDVQKEIVFPKGIVITEEEFINNLSKASGK